MMRVLALFIAVGVSRSAGVTPVEQVLNMMNDMKAKGEAMLADEKKVFDEYANWVDDKERDTKLEMKTMKSEIEKLSAFIEKSDADVAHLTKAIAEVEADIASMEAEKKDATKIRKTEHEEYLKTSQDLAESVDALGRAIQVMESKALDAPQALLQMQRMAVTVPGMKRVLAAFLQEKASADGAPEVAAYESQSGGITEMLGSLEKKFKTELDGVETEESNKAHAFDLLEKHLNDLLARNTADREEKAATKGSTAAASAKAKGDLADVKFELAEAEKMLQDMAATFSVKSETFATNQGVRADELKAISKAIEIISSPEVSGSYGEHVNFAQATSLLQTQSTAARVALRNKAATYLRKRAETLNSKILAAFASEVSANPFAKVIDMIKELVAKLKEEAAAEAEHKAYCDKELKSNKLKREKKTLESEKLAAQIEELSADIEDMGKEIATLIKEQAELTKEMGEATELRNKEKAENTDTISDAKVGAGAVKKALVVLREFYDSQGAFLQEKKQVPEMEAYKGMGDANGGVVGMLEVILSDFERLAAETQATETQNAQEYDGFMKDAKSNKKEKHEREVHLKLEKDDGEFNLSQLKKSKGGVDEELAKANEYYETLKPSCLEVKVSYEERVAQRKQEIEGLKEAYKILNSK